MDPMFPPKRKCSALAKKSLRVLRDLVGDDEDALELFEICRRHAANRVVVKRPDHVPPLFANPTTSYEGKLVRYDVYIANR
jgi:16S rRNA (guanine1516-N2)-methyltransferase